MSVINFPSSPELDQVHSDGIKSWRWNGVAWENFNLIIQSVALLDVDYDGGSASVEPLTILKSTGIFYKQEKTIAVYS